MACGPHIEFQCYCIECNMTIEGWCLYNVQWWCLGGCIAQRRHCSCTSLQSFTYFHYLKIVSRDPRTFLSVDKTTPNVTSPHSSNNDLNRNLTIYKIFSSGLEVTFENNKEILTPGARDYTVFDYTGSRIRIPIEVWMLTAVSCPALSIIKSMQWTATSYSNKKSAACREDPSCQKLWRTGSR